MSDLRSSNIYDMLDEDGGASTAPPVKKDAKSAADKPSNKKVDAPPKKEKPAKSEEHAAPLGKDQRGGGGRESKPRGRGRDNKGGLRGPSRPGAREFDRRSGPSSTHRNPREGKRHGGGQHNWGEAVEEGTKAAQNPEETPTSPPPPADEKTDSTPVTAAAAPGTENKDAEHKEAPEEEDKTLTYDQFLKKKEQQAPEGDKLEARAVDNDAFQGVAVKEVSSEKKKKKQQEEEEEKAEKATRKKKNVVTLDEFMATTSAPARQAPREPRPPRTAEPSERGTSEPRGRGRGRGGGGGRGASRGGGRGRGGGGPRSQAPVVDDGNFPKLGK